MTTSFKLETIESDTHRVEVPGGWVLRSRWVGFKTDVENALFIPDPGHEWRLTAHSFRWEDIELETYRAEVFGGWVVRSRWVAFRSDVESMIFVPDPSHAWRTGNDLPLKWETIEADTCRARAEGGWLVRGRWIAMRTDVESLVFVPDPSHEWEAKDRAWTAH